MSESTFPFQHAPSGPGAPAPELEESAGNRRTLLALAALAALALMAIAAYFLLFSGGGEEQEAAATTAATGSAPAPSDEPPAPADETAALPRISHRNFGTVPFKPLLVQAVALPEASAAPAPAPAPAPVPAATAPTPTDSGSADSTRTGSTGDTGEGKDAVPPADSPSYRFRVVRVADDNKTVNVKVDGQLYKKLHAGEVFAKYFKVRFIGGDVNAFQIGDEVFNVSGDKAITIST